MTVTGINNISVSYFGRFKQYYLIEIRYCSGCQHLLKFKQSLRCKHHECILFLLSYKDRGKKMFEIKCMGNTKRLSFIEIILGWPPSLPGQLDNPV